VPTDEAPAAEARSDSPHRLFALADGVFAISMTLLALDVRIGDAVPETEAGFASAAHDFYRHFGIFLLAFLITGRFWLVNHTIMSWLHAVEAGVLRRTVTFLAGICSLPIAATLLFRFDSAPKAVAFASLLLTATSLLSARLWWYLSDPARGLSDVDPKQRRRTMLNSLFTAGVFVLAVPLAYLLPDPAKASLIWLALLLDRPFFYLVDRRKRGDADGRSPG
jgi:uncharacterized membrane protein